MDVTVRTPGRWELPIPPGGPPRPEEAMPPWLAERLFDRRMVFLTGRVTPGPANTAAASLLSLDAVDSRGATGFTPPLPGRPGEPEPVYLHLAAPDGDLDAVFTVIDAMDSMRAPVYAVATGEVGGAAIGVLAAAQRRLAYPHARFRLAEPAMADLKGTADDVAAAAGSHLRALEDLVVRVAEATGQPRSRVEDDFSRGRLLDAEQARAYGLIHEVRGRA
ncbi:MAG TPA: ATP-dependent Clp protease proteolytic subunit [Natronosporangium sp.]|nr:ATP-dependent Clp protease proteolytic subunit [Natronosporangium sp.]